MILFGDLVNGGVVHLTLEPEDSDSDTDSSSVSNDVSSDKAVSIEKTASNTKSDKGSADSRIILTVVETYEPRSDSESVAS